MPHRVLVRLTRGRIVESEHYGSYCVVSNGRVMRSRGDIDRPFYYRSAAKPLQAVTVVESGAPERFGLTEEELALVCGSHDSSPRHVRTALSILAKCGEDAALLRCGGHTPISREVYEDYVRAGHRWGRIEDNCSGKHAGMIAAARALGAPAETYAEVDHPVQRRNLATVCCFTGLAEEQVVLGTDGCAVPSFAVPLEAMARAMARLTAPEDLPEPRARAAQRVVGAALRHPEMVAGGRRYDTHLIRAGAGRLLAKEGADGIQVIGVVGAGLGIAMKIADGARRALQALSAALLTELGVLAPDALADYHPLPVLSREGIPVGEIEVLL